MAKRVVFPFTAIVGQDRMKRALLLNAVNPRVGGVLIRGERGTAKSTASRALAALLPDIDIVSGSRFLDDPKRPDDWSDEMRELYADGKTVKTETRRTPFIDLPVSATEDRVVGTIDIEQAIQKGKKVFEPGVLAAANRGLLYVDEVNLLDDHVVDLLLDSAAMGINVVEREGISFTHPAKFILVGTMNPEEGDLRPQLLDRFAFSVNITGLADMRERVAIMERRIAFETNPEGFREKWQDKEKLLSDRIERARDIVETVGFGKRDLASIAHLTSNMNVDGHRGDLVILRGAQANAAFNGRERITNEDILLAAELALPHRVKSRIMGGEGGTTADELSDVLDSMRDDDFAEGDDVEMQDMESESDATGEKKKK